MLAWPNRNGFFYLIDRTNGKFLSAKAFVKQTWNDGFDFEKTGGRKSVPGKEPTPEGNDQVWPGIDGGANWMSHSYSPLTKLLYVFAREERRVYTKNEVRHPTTEPGEKPESSSWQSAAVTTLPGRVTRQGSGSRPKKAGAKRSPSIPRPARSSGSIASCRLPGVA